MLTKFLDWFKAGRTGQLLTAAWWIAAGKRAARTALVVAFPYFGATMFVDMPWLTVLDAAGFGAAASLITSFAGLVEVGGGQVSWWYAALERVTKTFFQSLGVGLGTAALFEQVDWPMVLQASALAAGGSLILAVMTKLPEADTLPSAVTPVTNITNTFTTETTQGTTLTAPELAPEQADFPLDPTKSLGSIKDGSVAG